MSTIRNTPTGSARKLTTMRLPGDLMKRIAVAARKEGRSRSNLVEKLLTDALKKREFKPTEEGAPDASIFG